MSMSKINRLPAGHRISLLSLLLLSGAAVAQYAHGAESLVWQCWFDGRTQYVLCEPQRALPPVQLPSGEMLELPALADSEPTEAVPASLAHRGIAMAPSSLARFPLRTQPVDMKDVKRLAQILMCGREPECRVDFFAAR